MIDYMMVCVVVDGNAGDPIVMIYIGGFCTEGERIRRKHATMVMMMTTVLLLLLVTLMMS